VLDFLMRCRLHITNPPKLPITPFLDNFRVADHPVVSWFVADVSTDVSDVSPTLTCF
jgi:hypothetical protein